MRTTVALALLLIPAAAGAQTVKWTQRPERCGPNQVAAADLGFTSTECVRCTISGKHVPDQPDIEFETEPVLTGIRKGGPADGKLEERDVLVAVDGQLITTRAAAIHYSWLTPGKSVHLTVRRQGVLKEVDIMPDATCQTVTVVWLGRPDVLTALKMRGQVSTMPLAPKTAAMTARARGWLGVGLSCQACGAALGVQMTAGFPTYPEIAQVTPDSPAAKAGIKVGDVLLAINGVSLKTEAGATAFREVKPNQRVTIMLIRNVEVLTLTMTAGEPR